MFSFFHPKPVDDSRPVAVMVVQQKASAQQETGALTAGRRGTASTELASTGASIDSN